MDIERQPEDISIIKKLYDTGFTNAEIAKLYRVSEPTISRKTTRRMRNGDRSAQRRVARG